MPEEYQTKLTSFIAEIEGLTVETDQKAVVMVNERTGTVVMGMLKSVKLWYPIMG